MPPAGDFTLASAAPLHAMLQEGIVDRNVKFTPVLDGYRMPEYIDWELQPFSNHKVMHTLCLVFVLMFILLLGPLLLGPQHSRDLCACRICNDHCSHAAPIW